MDNKTIKDGTVDDWIDYPEGRNDDPMDATHIIDEAIRKSHQRYRVAYRLPVFIVALVISVGATILLPLMFGWMVTESLEIATGQQAVIWPFVYWIALWALGMLFAGGVGMALIVTYSIWQATLRSGKRLWKLLRDR